MRCARDECDNTELTTKTATLRARSRVHVVLRVGSWFSRCHWCGTPQRPARWFYSSTAFHHANATPSAKFFPSGCCSPIVSCHRPLNLYPKLLHISHRENGSFEVLSLKKLYADLDKDTFMDFADELVSEKNFLLEKHINGVKMVIPQWEYCMNFEQELQRATRSRPRSGKLTRTSITATSTG